MVKVVNPSIRSAPPTVVTVILLVAANPALSLTINTLPVEGALGRRTEITPAVTSAPI